MQDIEYQMTEDKEEEEYNEYMKECTRQETEDDESLCQGTSETGNMLCPSTCGALTYLWNGHSRG